MAYKTNPIAKRSGHFVNWLELIATRLHCCPFVVLIQPIVSFRYSTIPLPRRIR